MINNLLPSCHWLACKHLPKIVRNSLKSISIGLLLSSGLFILVMLSWCYWWISLLDLWTEESCWLFSSTSPPSAKYWRPFHSLRVNSVYKAVSLSYPGLTLHSTLCLFFVSTEPHHLCILYVANLEFNVSKGFCHKIIWWFNKVCVPRRRPPAFLPPKQ